MAIDSRPLAVVAEPIARALLPVAFVGVDPYEPMAIVPSLFAEALPPNATELSPSAVTFIPIATLLNLLDLAA